MQKNLAAQVFYTTLVIQLLAATYTECSMRCTGGGCISGSPKMQAITYDYGPPGSGGGAMGEVKFFHWCPPGLANRQNHY